MGNLFNLQKVLLALGVKSVLSVDPQDLLHAKRVILPGVGAFEDGIANLKRSGMAEALGAFALLNRPLLGICLGMQLLLEEGEEGGFHQGLGLVKGRVIRFLDPLPGGAAYKIPHIGWSSLRHPVEGQGWEKTILKGIGADDYVYFVHSYVVCPTDNAVVLAQTEYGRQVFCSALHQDNIYGCQFHPEISGPVGLNILKQFLVNS
jgi:glutamine amidotransferase